MALTGSALNLARLGIQYADLHRARITGSVPRSMPILMFEVTRRCNLRCAYCGYPEHYPDFGVELTTGEIGAVLRDCVKLGTRIVSYGGGEPFVRADFTEIIAMTRASGIQVHIDSNGTRVDADVVAAIPDGPDVTFIFSLDHPDAEANDSVRGRGSHAGVVNAVRLLRKMRPSIVLGMNCVVGGHNVDRLADMVGLASELGIDGISFLPLHSNLAHRWRYEVQKAEAPETREPEAPETGDTEMPGAGNAEEPGAVPLDIDDGRRVQKAVAEASALAAARGLHTGSRRFVKMISGFPHVPADWQCWAGYLFGNLDPYGNLFPCYEIMDQGLNVRETGLVEAWRSPAMAAMRNRVRACSTACLSSGATEASLRMSPVEILRDPVQVARDLKFYFRPARNR